MGSRLKVFMKNAMDSPQLFVSFYLIKAVYLEDILVRNGHLKAKIIMMKTLLSSH